MRLPTASKLPRPPPRSPPPRRPHHQENRRQQRLPQQNQTLGKVARMRNRAQRVVDEVRRQSTPLPPQSLPSARVALRVRFGTTTPKMKPHHPMAHERRRASSFERDPRSPSYPSSIATKQISGPSSGLHSRNTLKELGKFQSNRAVSSSLKMAHGSRTRWRGTMPR